MFFTDQGHAAQTDDEERHQEDHLTAVIGTVNFYAIFGLEISAFLRQIFLRLKKNLNFFTSNFLRQNFLRQTFFAPIFYAKI